MSEVKKKIVEYLKANKEYQNSDGSLNLYKVLQCMDDTNLDKDFCLYLSKVKDSKIKNLLFSTIGDLTVLNIQTIIKIITSKEYVKNSTTFYSNQITQTVKEDGRTVLDWPHKDCVFLGGMDKEDVENKTEPFYHGLLDKDKIDNLFSPKVFSNVKRWGNSDDKNLIIKGNNLIALHSLIPLYKGKIGVIYLDPPYYFMDKKPADTFNYNSNFKLSTWLTFMKNRLEIAKDLLSDNGVLFLSINEDGAHELKLVMSEIFGKDAYLGPIIQNKGNAQNDAKNIQTNHEYIFVYSKAENGRFLDLLSAKVESKEKVFRDEHGVYFHGAGLVMGGGVGGTLNGRPFLGYTIYYNPKTGDFKGIQDQDIEKARTMNDESKVYNDDKKLISEGYQIIRPSKNGNKLGVWKKGLDNFNSNKHLIKIRSTKNGYSIVQKKYVSPTSKIIKEEGVEYCWVSKETNSKSIVEFSGTGGTNVLKELFNDKVFDNPKSLEMLEYLIGLSIDENIIVLDFFAGSGTTAHAVLRLNQKDGQKRKFILVEQMDYVESITSQRILKVIKKENLDEGFTYCELMKDSIKDRIKASKKSEELLKLVAESFDEGFFQYIDSKDSLLKILKEGRTLEDQKKILLDQYFDHNREYISYSDIKSVKLSKVDQDFNDHFYGKKKGNKNE